MLKQYSEQQTRKKKLLALWRARQEVEANGHGTSGYVVKHGANEGKILAHHSAKSTLNW
jgi:hypothetical protein